MERIPTALPEQSPDARARTPYSVAALARWRLLHERLNTTGHKRALQSFMVVVLAHWAEHLAQAGQIYILGWDVPDSRGVIGLWIPWVVESEVLHYGYAIAMLVGIWILRDGFFARSRAWWTASLAIQFWHHVEHGLLLAQAWAGHNLFGAPVPMSIVQLWIPRVELHLIYNSLVFLPMVVALSHHLDPHEAGEAGACSCTAGFRPRQGSDGSRPRTLPAVGSAS